MFGFSRKVLVSAELLDVKDLIMLFDVDKKEIYRWKKRGLLPMTKIGGKWYARVGDIQKLLPGGQ